jgi:GH25 family lysozyme M1 (1,4-beta-N-acetylmuramidase)
MTTLLLPDLSEFQPHADMAGIKRRNGGAAIIRAAYGTSHPDRAFTRLRADAAGYAFLGIYQYAVAAQDITAQALAFCRITGTLGPHEVPILDLEEGDGSQEARAVTWGLAVHFALGKVPWLYSGLDYAQAHGLAPIFNGPAVHTWVAAYRDAEPSLGHTLWQSTNGTAGANITDWPGAGKCDTNVYHGTLAELAALASPAAKPPPVPAVITDGLLVSKTMGWTGHRMRSADHGVTWTAVNP